MLQDIVWKDQRERIFKLTKNDGKSIFGVLHSPLLDTAETLIVFCGGLNADRCDINNIAVKFARLATKDGIHVARFDYTGLGISDGESYEMTISTKIEDILIVLRYLKTQINMKNILLLGFSDGARSVLDIALKREDITGIILWSPTLLNNLRETKVKPVIHNTTNTVVWPLRGIYIGTNYYRELKAIEKEVEKMWLDLHKETLIIWGKMDVNVLRTKDLVSNSRKLNVTENTISDAGHLFSTIKNHNDIFSSTFSWIKKNVESR